VKEFLSVYLSSCYYPPVIRNITNTWTCYLQASYYNPTDAWCSSCSSEVVTSFLGSGVYKSDQVFCILSHTTKTTAT